MSDPVTQGWVILSKTRNRVSGSGFYQELISVE